MTTEFPNIEYQYPGDQDETAVYDSFRLVVDEDGTAWLQDSAHHLMLSYAQAMGLHQTLGQALIRFDREFQMLPRKPQLKVYENVVE